MDHCRWIWPLRKCVVAVLLLALSTVINADDAKFAAEPPSLPSDEQETKRDMDGGAIPKNIAARITREEGGFDIITAPVVDSHDPLASKRRRALRDAFLYVKVGSAEHGNLTDYDAAIRSLKTVTEQTNSFEIEPFARELQSELIGLRGTAAKTFFGRFPLVRAFGMEPETDDEFEVHSYTRPGEAQRRAVRGALSQIAKSASASPLDVLVLVPGQTNEERKFGSLARAVDSQSHEAFVNVANITLYLGALRAHVDPMPSWNSPDSAFDPICRQFLRLINPGKEPRSVMLVLVREFTDEIGDRYWVQAQQRTYEVASLEKAEDHPEKLEADKVKIFECLTHDRSRFQNAVFFAICMFLMISLIANRILSTTFHSSEGGIARWVAVPVAGFVVGFGLTPFIMLAMKRWMPEPQTNAISAAWWPSMAGSLSLVLPVGVFRLILGAAGRYFPDYSCHGRWGIAFVPVAMGMCAAWIAPSCYAVGLGSVALVLAIGVTASMIVYSFGRAIDIADEFPLALMPVTIVLSLIFGAGAFMASPAVLIGVIGLAILIAIVHELLQRRAQQRLGTSDSELTLTASSDETPRTIEQLRIAIKGPKYHPPLAFQLVKKLIDPSITKPLQWIGLLGPAAAGKTAAAQHLIDEIQSLRPDLKVFSGRCTQDSPPYKPLREALAELGATAGIIVSGSPGGEVNTVFERLADEFIPFWDFISVDTDEEEGKETLRNEVLQGVLNVFRDLTQRQGVVLFLDDVQWIDEGSAALLKYLHENYAETSVHPLIIILAGREQPVLKNLGLDHVIVTLPPPSPTEQIRFLQTSFGIERQCAKHLVKALGVMSEEASNIFWLIRAVGELLSDNALIATPTGFQLSPSYARSGQLPIPEAMRAKLGASLRASGQYLPVLECAALLGQKFRVDDVAECLGMDRLLLLQILRHLEQELQLVRDVISDHECYAFSSEFMLEMVREELGVGTTHSPPSKIAKELHARIAAVLERRTPRTAQLIYDLAHHYFAAGTSYASKSVEYCLAAAEISRRHAELQTAQTYLKMAEKRASDDRRTLDHSQKRGMFGKGDPISAVSNKSAPETVPLPANSLTFDTPDVNHRLHGGDARISP